MGHAEVACRMCRPVPMFIVVAVVYSASSVLVGEAIPARPVPVVSVGGGVALAAMMLTGPRCWPVLGAAVVLADVAANVFGGSAGHEVWGSLAGALTFVLLGASSAVAWCGGTPDLRKRTHLVKMALSAGLVASLMGGVVNALLSSESEEALWLDIWHWQSGYMASVAGVVPPILLWRKQSQIITSRPGETAAMLFVMAVAAALTVPVQPLLLLVVLTWAALRLDVIGAALGVSTMAVVLTYLTVTGRGSFAEVDVPTLSALIAGIAMAFMFIAQESSGRAAEIAMREFERRERLRLQILARLAQELSAAVAPEQVGDVLAKHVLVEAGVKVVTLGLLDHHGRRLNWVRPQGWPRVVLDFVGGGFPIDVPAPDTDAVRLAKPILLRTMTESRARYPHLSNMLTDNGIETMVGWPLKLNGVTGGSLMLGWSDRQPLDPAQLAYVSAVATLVGDALGRAQIYADERDRASVLQAAVLPDVPRNTAQFDAYASYQPAVQGVGGDFFDVMRLPENRTYLALGDVVGHGLSAVTDMANLRGTARTLAYYGLKVERLLSELNLIVRDITDSRFATIFVAIYDPDAAILSYGSAGHPPALLRRAATGEVMELSDGHGPVLGPLEDAVYCEQVLDISPGDILLMYTDGLIERRGVDIDSGVTRLQQEIADWGPDTDLAAECERLHREMQGVARDDDICILAVRFTLGAGGGSRVSPDVLTEVAHDTRRVLTAFGRRIRGLLPNART